MKKQKFRKAGHKHRFTHYASSELVALALDIMLLWMFVNLFDWHYLVSVSAAYFIAITVHYYGVRKRVFHGTIRDPFHTYSYFLAVGLFGFAITLIVVLLSVTFIHSNYILARAFAALGVIPATYFFNGLITFTMPRPLPHDDGYCNIPDKRRK